VNFSCYGPKLIRELKDAELRVPTRGVTKVSSSLPEVFRKPGEMRDGGKRTDTSSATLDNELHCRSSPAGPRGRPKGDELLVFTPGPGGKAHLASDGPERLVTAYLGGGRVFLDRNGNAQSIILQAGPRQTGAAPSLPRGSGLQNGQLSDLVKDLKFTGGSSSVYPKQAVLIVDRRRYAVKNGP